MSLSLYKAMIKSHLKSLIGYFTGIFLYLILIILSFPIFRKSSSLNDALKALPAGLLKAFGIQGKFSNVNDYMAMNFYNSLYLYILMAFVVFTAVSLMAKYVDKGSMAYLLSTPASRRKISLTQISVLVTNLVIVSLAPLSAGLIGVPLLTSYTRFNKTVFLQINLSVFMIFLLIASYSFLISSIMNDEKQAMGLGFGITALFYAIDMASKLTPKLDWLKHFTIFSLYQPQKISKGNYDITSVSIGLLIASVIFFAISVAVFKKRDLSI